MHKAGKKGSFILAMLIVVGAFTSTTLVVPANATSNTQQQIHKAEEEKEQLEDKLEDTQDALNQLQGTQKDLQKELQTLNDNMLQISEELELLEQSISNKGQEIETTTRELEEAIALQEQQYQNMIVRVRSMYERSNEDVANVLLSQKSLSSILNLAEWFETLVHYDKRKLEEYKENRERVTQTKLLLEQEKAELDELQIEAEAKKNMLAGLISQTTIAIAQYGDQIAEAEAQAKLYEDQIREKEADLETLRKKLAEEIRLSQAAANGTWRDISEVGFADGDRKLLANLIYCEAGGEPYNGKVAVGAVVINRVLSGRYPDTVVGVIYQKSQFSPVASGRLALALAIDKANADCYRAADEAMAGITNVGNCVYFRTPIPGLVGIQIGGHIFY